MLLRLLLLSLFTVVAAPRCRADDGYRLWLKYDLMRDAQQRARCRAALQFIASNNADDVVKTAAAELQRGLQGLLGQPVPLLASAVDTKRGILLLVDPTANVAGSSTSKEGYRLVVRGKQLVVTGKSGAGVLYGVFALLRQLQTGQSIAALNLASSPRIQYRLLNHWDNPNGTVERGYAGASLWKWNELVTRYYTGADSVTWLQQRWASVRPAVDPALFGDVAARLTIQRHEALWWRDACVLYFQNYAKQPISAPFTPPTRTLAEVKNLVDLYQLK